MPRTDIEFLLRRLPSETEGKRLGILQDKIDNLRGLGLFKDREEV